MDSTTNKKPILILGVGNNIQKDDGIGVHVLEELQKLSLPQNIELFDGGTAGFDLIGVVSDREKVIVIDAVNGGQPPGTIYKFSPEDLKVKNILYDSLHQLGIIESLQMAKLMDQYPKECVIFGVEPQNIEWGLELTEPLKVKVPKIIELVLKELNISSQEVISGEENYQKEELSERTK